MPQSKSKDIKKRYWGMIVYPDSAPADWQQILEQTGVVGAISPLHDADHQENGELKKPHYHVLLTYGGPKSISSILPICRLLKAPAPQAIENAQGYYDYLTHKNAPEKAQYDKKDIKNLNGFSILDFKELKRSEVIKLKKEITQIIEKNNILEYSDLIDYLLDDEDLFDVASSNTLFFNTFITSRRHRSRSKDLDPE